MNENCECLRKEHTKHSFIKCSGLNSLSATDITDHLRGKTIVLITNINVQILSIISYQLIPTGFFTIVSLVCFIMFFLIAHLYVNYHTQSLTSELPGKQVWFNETFMEMVKAKNSTLIISIIVIAL